MLFLKIVLILSPTLVAYVLNYTASITYNAPVNGDGFLVVLYGFFIGAPLTALIGWITSRLTRKKARAKLYSFLGYLVPAFFACGYLLFN